MTLLVVAISLAAAIAFGWSTAAMHASASRTPAEVKGFVALLSYLLRRRRWISGMVASFVGLGLHALALRLGSLTVVQPIVVTGLVFSLLFGDLLARRKPARAEIVWSVVTVVGLSLFLVAAKAATGSARPSGTRAAAVLAVGVVIAIGCWLSSVTKGNNVGGLLLGAGAGVNFGLTAGTLKATAGSATLGSLVTSWPLYVLVVLGVTGFFANQVAYRRAPLAKSIPVLNVLNPVVALLYGVVAFDERPASDATTYLVAVASLSLALLGVWRLARSTVTQAPLAVERHFEEIPRSSAAGR